MLRGDFAALPTGHAPGAYVECPGWRRPGGRHRVFGSSAYRHGRIFRCHQRREPGSPHLRRQGTGRAGSRRIVLIRAELPAIGSESETRKRRRDGKMPQIECLLLSDDSEVQRVVKRVADNLGMALENSPSAAEGVERLRKWRFD